MKIAGINRSILSLTHTVYIVCVFMLCSEGLLNAQLAQPQSQESKDDTAKIHDKCRQLADDVRSGMDAREVGQVCAGVKKIKECNSVEGRAIFHFDDEADEKNARRILVFGMVHGDEKPTAAVVYRWVQRLLNIKSRNSWRLVPVANPDGFYLNQRTNKNGVDLNRNFPSKDWDEKALKWWEKRKKSDPRRYPGASKGSEPETQCMMSQIRDFKPDLVVSIHTPYGVLDYDGPSLAFPRVGFLPWVRLGTYPGSLGRYLWVDQQRPVLTIELKGNDHSGKKYFDLQDVSGTLAKLIRVKPK